MAKGMRSMRRRRHPILAVLSAALISLSLAACGGGQGSEGDTEIVLAQQPWEDLLVENQIAKSVLEEHGYRVTIQDLSVPVAANGMSTGQIDAYLGNWWPSQQSVFKKHIDNGDVEVLDTLVEGVAYEPAVPSFVAEKHGVRSIADLDENRAAFGGEILGIEPGTPGNQTIQDAIDKDAYGLGDWKLVESSTPAMLSEVQRKVKNEEPVAFLAWDPHWMNVTWDLVYLEDPENVWPGAGEIRVAARAGFADENPEAARFLSQMKVDKSTASEWIYQVSKKDKTPEAVASDWISKNQDQIDTWLQGVKSASGSE
ncbi:MAG: glycine/betaine ABC transporter substrate-binding protein [Actinophytocola sp.]|nr:glycine/betaine ABC transporter substrate-binding protein [Actinophytocola sp.]